MNRLLLLLFVLTSYFSCSQKNESGSIKADDFHLEIVDSLQIDYLGSFLIYDYDSVSQNYLAWIGREQMVLIIDMDGRITSNFNFPLEGPESLNGIVNAIGFRDGGIELNAVSQGFFRYDFQ